MPYMEERSQFDLIKTCMETAYNVCEDCTKDGPSLPPADLSVPAPSPRADFNLTSHWAWRTIAKANYVGNFGSDTYFSYPSRRDGRRLRHRRRARARAPVIQMLNDPSMKGTWKMGSKLGVKFAMIADGTSKTILASEIVAYPSAQDVRGAWTLGGMGGMAFTTRTRLPNPQPPPPTQLASCQPSPPMSPPGVPPYQFACTPDSSSPVGSGRMPRLAVLTPGESSPRWSMGRHISSRNRSTPWFGRTWALAKAAFGRAAGGLAVCWVLGSLLFSSS